MRFRCSRFFFLLLVWFGGISGFLRCQTDGQSESSSSNSPKHITKPKAPAVSSIDAGVVTNGLYRNKLLGMSSRIPAGWVLRTDEMNAQEEKDADSSPSGAKSPVQGAQRGRGTGEARSGLVLLAAFSRPPDAHGDEVNASILIAAESVATYPGLKDASQYFEPLTEVAKSQGFTIDEEPYESAIGEKILVRGDFHKDVGSRKMRQSTLAFLSHGYAVSITVIGGTEDEVEELINGIEFTAK